MLSVTYDKILEWSWQLLEVIFDDRVISGDISSKGDFW